MAIISPTLESTFSEFADNEGFRGKGPLCVALVVTQHARAMGLPLDSSLLITVGGGQVLNLGKAAVQSVLSRHGITRTLASEGGRTSRGSLGNMRAYVSFLNDYWAAHQVDLDEVESFWVARVHQFFAAKPFKIKLDLSRSLRSIIHDVIDQAVARQKTMPSVYYAGAVMQYLVGAKLDCALGSGVVSHNSYSTADAPTGRSGDFLIGDVALHVTTSPGEALIEKCRDNLNDGLRPVIVTHKNILLAEGLAENAQLADRIDVFEIEQFIALNLYELGKFAADGRKVAVGDLVRRYNEIVSEVDTDPSMAIELRP